MFVFGATVHQTTQLNRVAFALLKRLDDFPHRNIVALIRDVIAEANIATLQLVIQLLL